MQLKSQDELDAVLLLSFRNRNKFGQIGAPINKQIFRYQKSQRVKLLETVVLIITR